jgi:hypothetical protein
MMLGRGVLLGAVLAVGALLLVPGVAAAVGRAGRPIVRTAIKSGSAGAEVYEHVEDIVAEVRAEKEVTMENGETADDSAVPSSTSEPEDGRG